ncbi:thiolase family protein [Tabrizicola oligotrophica]|uniref:Acetyl-CoA C-acyltransferase n=1 Tax=Tabrizicola oligotrophica TaxID=2710650 RepID=A0A6M0QRD4_9RHOB|nr:acetyl-CoA C-acyltransferase [Tabrizicola oligotrophica]NEY90079.1 acetyl-CoA C-acyltransferase [Tabrizicola oligotrophica]
MEPVAIVSAQRTPIGAFQGAFSDLAAPDLGAVAVRAAVAQAGLAPERIDEALFGLVLGAGVGQAPARQAVLRAGLPHSIPCTTISKVCGSGMRAILDAALRIRAGEARVMLAGGMESMTNAPHLIPNSRRGQRLGHGRLIDHMFFDGLEDAYDKGALMGQFAELCAGTFGFTRAEQDAWAIRSLERALDAQGRGAFAREIAPVTVTGRKGAVVVAADEQPGLAQPAKIPLLKPAFRADGTVTAASSSSISDGAAALVLASGEALRAQGLAPRAWIIGAAGHAQEPAWFSTAPVAATRKLLDRLGWQAGDVDLWEVNEAFAVVALAFVRELALPEDRVNVNGGACALGHPIGASGARIVVTLLHALEDRGLKRGIASICIGGGEALSIAIARD